MSDDSRWFALKVRHQHEQAAATVLGLKQLEAFSPTLCQRRRWSDRTKVLVAPLFPSYVFCRFENEKRLSVLNTPGVLSIVGFGNSPAPVADEEIAAVRTAIASGKTIEPWPYLRAGERVEVTHGPLKNLKGVLVQSKNDWRVVISVDLLMRSLAVEVDRDCLASVDSFA
jgi:transcription antitermination factor NusG